jgi:hypothetical protein
MLSKNDTLGGSVVILIPAQRTDMGKSGSELELNHNLKLYRRKYSNDTGNFTQNFMSV